MKGFTVRRAVACANLTLLVGTITLALSATALAATPPPPTTIAVQETPPPASAPNFIITSIVGSPLPQYIELYNQGDTPINLHGWQLTFTTHDGDSINGCADTTTSISLTEGWILSKKYLTLEQTGAPDPESLTSPFSIDDTLLAGCVAPRLTSLALSQATDEPEQTITIPATLWSPTAVTVAQHKQRGNSPSSTRNITGVFDTDYKIVTGAITLNSDPLYTPPASTAGLQILEILPNARSCSPLDTDPTCSDYVKLFNSTGQPINLALYRLRIGYRGMSQSVTNTFTWGKYLDPANDELILPPQQYLMLTARNDGQPLSVTDSGNYIWLEDAYGTTVYEPIVQYPDASSTTKVGQAWAYDGASWLWTSAPRPGEANYFPPVISPSSTTVSVGGSLKPCNENQYRNPLTNRCNAIVTTASVLTPCGPNEERNPDTNRCRSVVAAAQTLVPCDPGWERNPETNRCRKVAQVAGDNTTAAVHDVTAPSSDRQGWVVAAIAIAFALGYALYEWRQDLRLLKQKATTRITYTIHKVLHK